MPPKSERSASDSIPFLPKEQVFSDPKAKVFPAPTRAPGTFFPRNPYIRNNSVAKCYLACLRRKWRVPSKIFGLLLNCQIASEIPDRLFIPHPIGIVVDTHSVLGNDVVLCQQVTLGVANPYYHCEIDPLTVDPIIEEGVYIGPGAKILGHITIGKWSVIGANATVTLDIPAYSIVVGHNRILDKKSTEL